MKNNDEVQREKYINLLDETITKIQSIYDNVEPIFDDPAIIDFSDRRWMSDMGHLKEHLIGLKNKDSKRQP